MVVILDGALDPNNEKAHDERQLTNLPNVLTADTAF
jgi:hypothetical protein